MLALDRIETIASGDKVSRIAVENFLGTIPDDAEYQGTMMNLYQDAKAYDWNVETQVAIRGGLLEHFFGGSR